MTDIDWNDWFVYDETSPTCLRWKVTRLSGRNGNKVNCSAGDCAGSVNFKGYFSVGILYKQRRCHRIIVEMHGVRLGALDCIDHIDGDKKNNKISNLRVVNNKTNCRNRGLRGDSNSGVTGVSAMTTWDGFRYWISSWSSHGIHKGGQKTFSVLRHGEEGAFKMACEFRLKMLEELNSAGAGYTGRHGLIKTQ